MNKMETDMNNIVETETLKEASMIVAKFSTLAGGVWIEDNGSDERKASDRCWRFDNAGNSEWATFADLTSSNPAPRWYGHQFKYDDFVLC